MSGGPWVRWPRRACVGSGGHARPAAEGPAWEQPGRGPSLARGLRGAEAGAPDDLGVGAGAAVGLGGAGRGAEPLLRVGSGVSAVSKSRGVGNRLPSAAP